MKLYHGSVVTVKKPSLRQGRPNTDYGKGFYTTVDFDQAARWARIRRDRAGGGNAVVSVYEVDDNLLKNAALKVIGFNSPTCSSTKSSPNPLMAFNGVRISCPICAKKRANSSSSFLLVCSDNGLSCG